ncbi:MAG: glycosyltransferase [Candidatus Gribaldobacteria bacterium]|nr:glycosyltransferase [Candidatus Gribaldobacteria bacterium]
MTILSIGYTRELFEDNIYSDTRQRLLFYSQQLDKYYVIAHSMLRDGLKPKKIADNFEAIPSGGINRAHSFFKIISIGSRICSRERVDLIQAQDPVFTGLAGRILSLMYKIPMDVTVYGINPFDKHWRSESFFNKIAAPLAKYILRKANGIQVDGSQAMCSLIQNKLDPSRIFLKPLVPLDSHNFYNSDGSQIRDKLLGSQFDKIVLFVGRLTKQKNLKLYMQVIKSIVAEFNNRVLFVIVGQGNEEIKIKKLASNLGIDHNIIWIPRLSRSEIPLYFAAADVFALPSLYEGFARVLMEAAMAGKPIITTAVSGADDAVINGETGFIVGINNKAEFKDRLKDLLKNEAIAKKMGSKAQKLMREKYDSNKILWKQIEIWNQVIKAK